METNNKMLHWKLFPKTATIVLVCFSHCNTYEFIIVTLNNYPLCNNTLAI